MYFICEIADRVRNDGRFADFSHGAPSRRALRIDQILRVFIVIIFVGQGELK